MKHKSFIIAASTVFAVLLFGIGTIFTQSGAISLPAQAAEVTEDAVQTEEGFADNSIHPEDIMLEETQSEETENVISESPTVESQETEPMAETPDEDAELQAQGDDERIVLTDERIVLTDGTLYIDGSVYLFEHSWENYEWFPYKDQIKHIIIGEGVTSIPSGAFEHYPNLESVTLPSTLQTISSFAFMDCENLRTITFAEQYPNGLIIGEAAFENIGVERLVLPEGLTEIGPRGFRACKNLTYLKIPDSLEIVYPRSYDAYCD